MKSRKISPFGYNRLHVFSLVWHLPLAFIWRLFGFALVVQCLCSWISHSSHMAFSTLMLFRKKLSEITNSCTFMVSFFIPIFEPSGVCSDIRMR